MRKHLVFVRLTIKSRCSYFFKTGHSLRKHTLGIQIWTPLTYFLNKKPGQVTNCLWLPDRIRLYFPLKADSSLAYNKIEIKLCACSGQITNQLKYLHIITNANVRHCKELHIRKQIRSHLRNHYTGHHNTVKQSETLMCCIKGCVVTERS